MTDNQRIINGAREYLSFFRLRSRKNGQSGTGFYITTDNRPKDLHRMVVDLHGDMPPDDYVYEYVHDALELISERSPEDEIEGIEAEIEPDHYIGPLLAWAASDMDRHSGYCDDALKELHCTTLFDVLSTAQLEERRTIFAGVLSHLRERAAV